MPIVPGPITAFSTTALDVGGAVGVIKNTLGAKFVLVRLFNGSAVNIVVPSAVGALSDSVGARAGSIPLVCIGSGAPALGINTVSDASGHGYFFIIVACPDPVTFGALIPFDIPYPKIILSLNANGADVNLGVEAWPMYDKTDRSFASGGQIGAQLETT